MSAQASEPPENDPPIDLPPRQLGVAAAEDDPRRCRAHKSDGSGERCGNWALVDQFVCRYHGGASPNGKSKAKQRAQLRLLDLLPVATKKHREILETSTDERVVLQAVKMVYDRTGLEEGSASVEASVVREMVKSRILDLAYGVEPEPDLPPLDEEEIFDAEIVDDEDLI